MRVLVCLLLISLGSACGPSMYVFTPPTPVQASPQIARLRVFVSVPTAQYSDQECGSYGQATTVDVLRLAIQRELTNAGMVVVIDQTTPHELTADATANLIYCSGRYKLVGGSTQLTLAGGGRMLAQEAYGFRGATVQNRGTSPEEFANQAAATMVRAALVSDPLNAFAAQPTTMPAIGTPTGPPPTETPPTGTPPTETPIPVAPAAGGCSKDTDCKGDRVCEKGACTSPH